MLLRDLLRICETGDGEAVAELVRRFRPWALDLAAAIIDDRDLAEDAVQEAFIAALGRLAELREPDAFPGWFRQIIRTQAGRVLRRRRELPTVQDETLPAAHECSLQDHVQAQELREVVRKALRSLPSAGRDTAELYYLEEMSCASISDRLGVPEGTVKSRLHDARARLKVLLLGYVRDEEPDLEKDRHPGFPLSKETAMSNTMPVEFETLIMAAQARGASDLHLIPGEPPTLRVDGVLERSDGSPLTAAETMAIAAAVIPSADLDRVGRELGEAHRLVMVGEVAARVCVARARGDITIAARLLPTMVPGIDLLGLPGGLRAAADMPSGLIVISGRSGSGKSTTAYSLLDHINATRKTNIHTFEDPIMYRLTPKRSLVQQREVGVDIRDTVSGLKQSMCMDPDVVFVSEIRTLDELQACLTVAEIGHLVIIVIHAESPEGAIQRIVDVFPDHMRPFYRRVLAGVLKCVSCQRLVPRASGRGRVAAYGLLVPDEEMRTAINDGTDVFSRRRPLPQDCLNMQDEIERMAHEGVISDKI